MAAPLPLYETSGPVRIFPDHLPGPDASIGYQAIEWAMEWLVHGITGEPLVLTEELEDLIIAWYEITPANRFRYNQGYLRRARGTGKSPGAAVLGAIELCGPCRFGGRDERGHPIGVPEMAPLVQIFSTSMEQTKPIFDILANSFSDRAINEYGLVIGKEAVAKTMGFRGAVQRIPNSYRALRGPRPSITLCDETSELVSSNDGHASLERIGSNLAKRPGGVARRFDFGNAFKPGEDSAAERVHNAYFAQMEKLGKSKILYDNLEPDPGLRPYVEPELREAIRQAAGDAHWIDEDRLVDEAQNPEKGADVFAREHLNLIISASNALINAQVYEAAMKPVPPPLQPADRITLGFDAARTSDATALVAFRLSDRSFHVIDCWTPDFANPQWTLDEELVDERIDFVFQNFDVVAAAFDVHPLSSWVSKWNKKYGELMAIHASTAGAIIFDNRHQQTAISKGTTDLITEIEARRVRMGSSRLMQKHWANAISLGTKYGILPWKKTKMSRDKIDIVMACVMAFIMAIKIESGVGQKPPRRPMTVVELS